MMNKFLKIMGLSKKPSTKEPWQIAAARYCANNAEAKFTKEGLIKYVMSEYKVNEQQVTQFYEEEITHPSGRQRVWSSVNGVNMWTPPLDLVAKITDYDELQEARESSRQAMVVATWSLVITGIVGIVQICVAIYK